MKDFRIYKTKNDKYKKTGLILNKLVSSKDSFLKASKIRIYALLACIAFIFSGCFAPSAKIVYVPSPCDVPKREKPRQDNNALKYLKEVLIYAEGLESDLSFCRGELTN